jgi:hypothetical protein
MIAVRAAARYRFLNFDFDAGQRARGSWADWSIMLSFRTAACAVFRRRRTRGACGLDTGGRPAFFDRVGWIGSSWRGMVPSSVRLCLATPNRQNRAGGEADQALRDAPEEDLRHPRASMRPDHEQVRAGPPRCARDLLVWRPVEKKRGCPHSGLPRAADKSLELLLSVLSGPSVDRLVGPGRHEGEVGANRQRQWR